jgi:hypothetical protein
MAVQLSDKVVMAASVYPKEANPLWGETSTITVAHTLKATLHILIILIQSGIRIGRGSGNGISYDLLEFWSSRCKWVTSEQIKRNDGSCDT